MFEATHFHYHPLTWPSISIQHVLGRKTELSLKTLSTSAKWTAATQSPWAGGLLKPEGEQFVYSQKVNIANQSGDHQL